MFKWISKVRVAITLAKGVYKLYESGMEKWDTDNDGKPDLTPEETAAFGLEVVGFITSKKEDFKKLV